MTEPRYFTMYVFRLSQKDSRKRLIIEKEFGNKELQEESEWFSFMHKDVQFSYYVEEVDEKDLVSYLNKRKYRLTSFIENAAVFVKIYDTGITEILTSAGLADTFWGKTLIRLESDESLIEECYSAADSAYSWTTCACGQTLKAIDEYNPEFIKLLRRRGDIFKGSDGTYEPERGTPLYRLGLDFAAFVADREFTVAALILVNIENYVSSILNDAQKRSNFESKQNL